MTFPPTVRTTIALFVGGIVVLSIAGSDGPAGRRRQAAAFQAPLVPSAPSVAWRQIRARRESPLPSSSSSLTMRRNGHPSVGVGLPTDRPPPSPASAALLASAVSLAAAFVPLPPAHAYVPSDYASETVQAAVTELERAKGDVDGTFKAYEGIAGIITEGKGVGGMVNYQGIQLERGYVADEDTTIYNPGLTLLTESEKERLVEAVIDARRVGLSSSQWSENNEFAYEFLKSTLDPLHMVELSWFLKVLPIYGAVLYAAVLAVQQFARDSFPVAYLAGAAAFFLPILALVAAGPQ